MKRRWYRAPIIKGILIVAEHILVVIMAVCIIWILSYPAGRNEMFEGKPAKNYEETKSFNELLRTYSHQVMNGIGMRDRFETDGVYNPQKIVDIQEYYNESEITNENLSGLAYRLQDLSDWAQQWLDQGEENSSYDDNAGMDENIIVCKRSDNTYHYYYYSEFRNLIDSGELRFVIASDDSGVSEEDILNELQDGNFYNNTVNAFKGLQDVEGKIAYIDCWSYDGQWLAEEYQTVDGKSVMEIANDNPIWNGRLSEAYEMLRYCIYQVESDMREYNDLSEFYQEGDTNFAYLYVDTDTKRVYTNRKAYQDYDKAQENLEMFRKMGKYAIIMPKLADFETNFNNIDASDWQEEVKNSGNKEEGFIYAVGVDTTYPIKDAFYTESQLYDKYGTSARGILVMGCAASIVFLILLVWLTVIAGRNPQDEELHLNGFDRWKTEIAALVVIGGWCIPVALGVSGITYSYFPSWGGDYQLYQADYIQSAIPYMICGALLAVYTCALFLTGFLSLVRRIKARTLWKNSLLRWFGGFIKVLFCNFNEVWQVIIVFGVIGLFSFFALIEWASVMGITFLLPALILGAELAAFVYMVRQAIGKQRIKEGILKIAEGEVEYKIPLNGLNGDQKIIAEKINSIGEGLDRALEESMKSERLKTDLITNVSHDIKTPLTSIINYVDLLKKENLEDPKIQRYLEILEAKAQRLKTLTEDVVEASKVSSGNITLEYMNINFVEMIQQTSGEFEEKFKARELKEVLLLPEKEIVIRADGRRLWRVLANIYNNAAKYAMEGTRVYAELKVVNDSAVFSLKNISQQPLNISADELTERFIRGDISRSTEGSGLGLSIAKSLTQMQGGKFELYLDGDLFRVTITFPIGTGQM